MLRSSLCDYSYAYILVSATITIPNTAAAGAGTNNRKNIIIKNCAPFSNCISKVKNTQIGNAKEIYRAMLMYSLREYSDNYSKTLEVYGIATEMSHFQMLMVLLLIFLLIMIRVVRLNLKQK